MPSRRWQVSRRRRAIPAILRQDCRKGCEAAPKRRRPRQPHPGTRIIRYRCFLPDLAEFANYRRGGTDGATIDVKLFCPACLFQCAKPVGCRTYCSNLAERAGFEPAIRLTVYTLSRRAPSTTRTPLHATSSVRQSGPTKKRKDSVRALYRQASVAQLNPHQPLEWLAWPPAHAHRYR